METICFPTPSWLRETKNEDVVLFCTFGLSDHQWLEVVSTLFFGTTVGPDVAAIGKDFCDHMHRGDEERLEPSEGKSPSWTDH